MEMMKRITILSSILTVLVGIDGIYMMAVHYKPDDVNRFNLSDGGTLIFAAVILLIITIISYFFSREKNQSKEVK